MINITEKENAPMQTEMLIKASSLKEKDTVIPIIGEMLTVKAWEFIHMQMEINMKEISSLENVMEEEFSLIQMA